MISSMVGPSVPVRDSPLLSGQHAWVVAEETRELESVLAAKACDVSLHAVVCPAQPREVGCLLVVLSLPDLWRAGQSGVPTWMAG